MRASLNSLWPSDSRSNWNLEMLVFEKEGKTGGPREKTRGARMRTNNKLNPHMTLGPAIEPGGPHWWEASALTTAAPSPLSSNTSMQKSVHVGLAIINKEFHNFCYLLACVIIMK